MNRRSFVNGLLAFFGLAPTISKADFPFVIPRDITMSAWAKPEQADEWHHFQVERRSDGVRLFVDALEYGPNGERLPHVDYDQRISEPLPRLQVVEDSDNLGLRMNGQELFALRPSWSSRFAPYVDNERDEAWDFREQPDARDGEGFLIGDFTIECPNIKAHLVKGKDF